MSKLAIHIGKYKKSQVALLWKHNMRTNKNYSNENIDLERKKDNMVLLCPDDTLYKETKRQIEGRVTGRINRESIWIVEGVVYSPVELDEQLQKQYFEDVLVYLSDKFGADNMLLAVVHCDEHRYHMHFDFVPIIGEKLSAKEMVTRKVLREVHDELSERLISLGYPVERGTQRKGEKLKSLSVEEYKVKAEAEKQKLMQEQEKTIHETEYLTYKKEKLKKDCKRLSDVREELEEDNVELAQEIIESVYSQDLIR